MTTFTYLDGTNRQCEVKARRVEITTGGELLFIDEHQNVIYAVAPGYWMRVEVKSDETK